jgi:hypothetical protein
MLSLSTPFLSVTRQPFTLSVYQHVLPGMQADAANAFSAAVFG